jgi:glycolate oxidase
MDEKHKKALADIVGKENVTDATIDLVSYSSDFSEHEHRPEGAVWPMTTEQVSRIMQLAHREGIPVTPRGAGTGATGMALPSRGGLVMDLVRMNRIIDIRIEDRVAVVQPGVVYADLQRALASDGFFFPPDPASGKVSTLGGNVATNAGGLKGAKYGTTRDYVLGLEVVLPDGRTMRTGSRCMKSASGYDLTRLFVGSEGTLGIATEITLKINPMPLASSTALAAFGKLADAGDAVSRIMHSGIIPSVCEFLDRHIIALLIARAGLELPRAEAMVLVETDGYTQGEADFQMEEVIAVFRNCNALEIKKAATREEAGALWQGRKSLGSVILGLEFDCLVEDVTVPMSKLTDLLEGIDAISRKYGIRIMNLGHAGDGNLHPHFLYRKADDDQVRMVEKAVADVFALACDLGGTLTGEHGIGLSKAPFMGLEHDPVALDLMWALKKLVDPHNILNPGKMGFSEKSGI